MQTRDALNRQLPNHPQSTGKRIRLVPARLAILERIHWHGDLPRDHVRAFLKAHGMNDKTSIDMAITDMSREENNLHGGVYLKMNPRQYPHNPGNYVPRSHHIIYGLAPAAIKALEQANRWRGHLNGGQWWHETAASCLTAEIELGTTTNQLHTFIPRHRVTTLANTYEVPLDGKTTKLHDDGMFGIDYAGKQHNFFLEIDLGTEQLTGIVNVRKTVERMVRQWHSFLERVSSDRSIYAKTFDTTKPALVLLVFTSEQRMRNAMELIKSKYLLFRTDTRFARHGFQAPKVSLQNYTGEWLRSGYSPMRIDRAV